MALLGELVDDLHNSLGANASWQSWLGVSDTDQAKGRVHPIEIPLDAGLPCIQIGVNNNLQIDPAYLTTTDTIISGPFLLAFFDDMDLTVSENRAFFNFFDNTSDVIKQLIADATASLPITRARVLEGPRRVSEEDRDTEGDFLRAIYAVEINGEPA